MLKAILYQLALFVVLFLLDMALLRLMHSFVVPSYQSFTDISLTSKIVDVVGGIILLGGVVKIVMPFMLGFKSIVGLLYPTQRTGVLLRRF